MAMTIHHLGMPPLMAVQQCSVKASGPEHQQKDIQGKMHKPLQRAQAIIL